MIFLLLKLGENLKEVFIFCVLVVVIVENLILVLCGVLCLVFKGFVVDDDV